MAEAAADAQVHEDGVLAMAIRCWLHRNLQLHRISLIMSQTVQSHVFHIKIDSPELKSFFLLKSIKKVLRLELYVLDHIYSFDRCHSLSGVSVLVVPCSTDVHPFEFSRLQARG